MLPVFRNAHTILSASVAMSCAHSGTRPKHNVLLNPTTFTLVSPGSTTQANGLKESHIFWMKIILILFSLIPAK